MKMNNNNNNNNTHLDSTVRWTLTRIMIVSLIKSASVEYIDLDK